MYFAFDVKLLLTVHNFTVDLAIVKCTGNSIETFLFAYF